MSTTEFFLEETTELENYKTSAADQHEALEPQTENHVGNLKLWISGRKEGASSRKPDFCRAFKCQFSS